VSGTARARALVTSLLAILCLAGTSAAGRLAGGRPPVQPAGAQITLHHR